MAAAAEEGAAAVLSPSRPTRRILLLQPAVVLIQTLLPARGPPVHSSSQVRQTNLCSLALGAMPNYCVVVDCRCHVANSRLAVNKQYSLVIFVF